MRVCNSSTMRFRSTRCASRVRFVSFRKVEFVAAGLCVTQMLMICKPVKKYAATDKPLQMKNGKHYTITDRVYKNVYQLQRAFHGRH